MREIIVRENEAGQRLDKFLRKYMSEAPGSFLYKMLRKKNIVWNGKKATGSEKLKEGDRIFFLCLLRQHSGWLIQKQDMPVFIYDIRYHPHRDHLLSALRLRLCRKLPECCLRRQRKKIYPW